jgi:hydroxyacylglutathione hydrolase
MLNLRKVLFVCVVASVCLMTVAVAQNAPAAGGGRGGAGAAGRGGAGGGMGTGGRGAAAVSTRRPDKAARLASIAEIEKQIEALRAAIQKAPAADPLIQELEGDALTSFTTQYTEESTAVNAIASSLNAMHPVASVGARSVNGITIAMVTELKKLAQEDKAAKLTARLDTLTTLIQERSAIQKTEVAPGVYKLVPPATGTPVNMFLVLGTEKAMLVDTAYPGDITPADVEAMTKLPYIVVNTHAHPDHDGSNNAFKQIYISEADMASARSASGSAELIPIKEGYVFDLGGGKKLEVISVPGHTLGSICLLDAQAKVLITGDTANPNLLLNFTNIPIETFKKNIERLLQWKDQYNLSLAGHGGPFPVSYITDTIACAQEIVDGKAQPPAQPAQGAAAGGRGGASATHTYGSIRITYNPNNIRESNNN